MLADTATEELYKRVAGLGRFGSTGNKNDWLGVWL